MCEKIQVSKMAVETNNRCVQRGSKVSELFEKTEKCNAQRHSKLSESAVQNEFCCSAVHFGRSRTDGVAGSKMFEKTNDRCAQRHSKVSESAVQNGLCCSAVHAGRGIGTSRRARALHRKSSARYVSNMSRMFEKTNDRCAQRHSKVSESSVQNGLCCSAVRAGRGSEPLAERERYTGKVLHAMCPICPECLRRRMTVVLNDTPKCRSRLSKMGCVVVPSVPDGGIGTSRRARALHRKTFCTQVSGMSKMLFENLIET